MTELAAIVLAAGRGTRMHSARPKVLHSLAGRPLLFFPVHAALEAGATRVVVVVSPDAKADVETELRPHLPGAPLEFVVQETPQGTGHAASVGLSALPEPAGEVLVLYGDTPLLEAGDLQPLVERLAQGDVLSFLSFEAEDPTGYGRVLRDGAGAVRAIVEERDISSDAERSVREVNAGIYAGRRDTLSRALAQIGPHNAQGEYYLTDVVPLAAKEGAVTSRRAPAEATVGVNDRQQLAFAEGILHARIRSRWGKKGVSIVGEPLIDDTVELGLDVRIEQGVRLRGKTRVGGGAFVDVGCVLEDVEVAPGAVLKPYTVATRSSVGERAVLGPFSHLRPDSHIGAEAHVGNFVETKNATLASGAKANHLTYLGDADIGERSNIGAGVIVCNYDGFAKRRTTVGVEAFVGSDVQLVAPVTVGDGAYVATGTTVTEDVPSGALAIGRSRQENKAGYAKKLRERLRQKALAERKK